MFDDVAVVGVIVLWRRFEDDQLSLQSPHSVFTNELINAPGQPTRDDEVIAFFRKTWKSVPLCEAGRQAPQQLASMLKRSSRIIANVQL